MAITLNSAGLLEAIDKVNKVTGSTTLNFIFSGKEIKIISAVNEYQMELVLPQEKSFDQEMKFCIFSKPLVTALSGKKEITLDLVGNTLNFKAGRSKGSLVTLPYEDKNLVLNDGVALSDDIKAFLFSNLDRVNFKGKNVDKNILLQVQIKDSKIKMLSMESSYSGLVVEPLDANPIDADFNILLRYAETIINTFSRDDTLKLVSTDNSVEITSATCKIVLPRIAECESVTIPEMENVIENNIRVDDRKGSILFNNPTEFLKDIDELKSFVDDESIRAKIRFKKVADNDNVLISVNTANGKLDKILTDIKTFGEFEAQFNIENFRACLEKNTKDKTCVTFYSNCATIRSSNSKESVYIVLKTE